jgi:hypothetical protein
MNPLRTDGSDKSELKRQTGPEQALGKVRIIDLVEPVDGQMIKDL